MRSGGNFGVVTAITYQLHVLGPVFGGPAIFRLAAAPLALLMYRELTRIAPDELLTHAVLVLVALSSGSKYYSQIRQQAHGISHKMLSQTLRNLDGQGFVVRTVHPTVPPRLEYALTPLAETLMPTLLDLITWSEAHARELLQLSTDA